MLLHADKVKAAERIRAENTVLMKGKTPWIKALMTLKHSNSAQPSQWRFYPCVALNFNSGW
jgi:hypothetical protein